MSSPTKEEPVPKLRKVIATGEFSVSATSDDGASIVLAHDEEGVSVLAIQTTGDYKLQCSLDHKEVKRAGFSPSGKYVCTMHRKIDSSGEVPPQHDACRTVHLANSLVSHSYTCFVFTPPTPRSQCYGVEGCRWG